MTRVDGGGFGTIPGNSWPVKQSPVAAGSVSGLSVAAIQEMFSFLPDGSLVSESGAAHARAGVVLAGIADQLVKHVQVLSENWGGAAAQTAVTNFQQLHETASSLAQASTQTGAVLSWLGPVISSYKNYTASIANTSAGKQAAQAALSEFNQNLVDANGNLPTTITKNLPNDTLGKQVATITGPGGGVAAGTAAAGASPGGGPSGVGGGTSGTGGATGATGGSTGGTTGVAPGGTGPTGTSRARAWPAFPRVAGAASPAGPPAPVFLAVRRPAVRPAEPPVSGPSPRPPERRAGRPPPVMAMVAFLVMVPIQFRPAGSRVTAILAWAALPVTVPILAWAASRVMPIRFRSAACRVAAIQAAWAASPAMVPILAWAVFPAMVPILAGSAAFRVTAPIRFRLAASRVVPGASAVPAARVAPAGAAPVGRA
jgi:hypothetical protein